MNCGQMEKVLITYLDGNASPSQRREIETHLAQCAACRNQVAEFGRLWSVLDELPIAMPSDSFDATVRARLAQEPRRESAWSWLVPTPRMAFAVTVLAVLSVWLSSMQPPRQPAKIVSTAAASDSDFRMIKDLPALEDYDVLANFDPLSDLPAQPGT